MPIFKVGTELHYFAHVPKCAGGSVVRYLKNRFGPLALNEGDYMKLPRPMRWSNTVPQHLPYHVFADLIPPDWIVSSFATVRDPLSRLKSAYKMRLRVGQQDFTMSIDEWFADWIETEEERPFRYNSHLKPQTYFIPPGATLFRLETELGDVVTHVDKIAGSTTGPRRLPRVTRGSEQNRDLVVAPSSGTIARAVEYYRRDYEELGYPLPQLATNSQSMQ